MPQRIIRHQIQKWRWTVYFAHAHLLKA